MSKPQTWLSPATYIVLLALLVLLSSLCTRQTIHASFMVLPEPWNGPSIEGNTADLIENCPLPLVNLSQDCESAVDEFFEKIPLESSKTTWISLPNRLTYGRAFKNPVQDRSRVLQALQKKECRLEGEKTIRWDLAEFCHADAFANLSVFLWACNEYSAPANPSDYVVDMSRYAAQEFSRPEYYESKLHNKIVRILEKHWFGKKCAKYEISDLRFDSKRDQEQYQLLHSTAKRLEEDWRSIGPPYTFVLKSLAARLGDLSTAMVYSGPSSPRSRDDSWVRHANKLWPWRSSLSNFEASTGVGSGRRSDIYKRLQKGISLAVSLQATELEFDWNFLVERVCTLGDSEEISCQTAIEKLRETLDWDQRDELQTLDKFESVSHELNLLD